MEKVTLRIILKNFLVIEKVKTARKKTLMVKKLFESSIKKIKKTNQTEFRIGKAIMKNGMNYMLNGKVMIIPLLSYDKDTV